MSRNKLKNYYKVLGIPHTATKNEIKLAYRKLVKIWHPDVCDKPNSHEKTSELIEAYDILNDDKARAEFDLACKNYTSQYNKYVYANGSYTTPYSPTQSQDNETFTKKNSYAGYSNTYQNSDYKGPAFERDFGYSEENIGQDGQSTYSNYYKDNSKNDKNKNTRFEFEYKKATNYDEATSYEKARNMYANEFYNSYGDYNDSYGFENETRMKRGRNKSSGDLFMRSMETLMIGGIERYKELSFFDKNIVGFKVLIIALISIFIYYKQYFDLLYVIGFLSMFLFFRKKKFIGIVPVIQGILIMGIETGIIFAIIKGVLYFIY